MMHLVMFVEDEDLPSSQLMLIEILNDFLKNRKLRIDLAVAVHASEHFIKATY